MKRKLILMGLALACIGTPVQSQVHPTGFIVVAPTGEVQFYLSRPLRSDIPLWAQWPNQAGQIVCCKRFRRSELFHQVARSGESTDVHPFEMLLSNQQKPVRYVLRRGNDAVLATSFVGIAMAAPAVRALGKHELRSSAGQRVRFCSGTEGVNLLTQYRRRKSAAYMSLGYSIKPINPCTRKDEDFIATVKD